MSRIEQPIAEPAERPVAEPVEATSPIKKPTMNKILESKVKIRFPDCDPFNHLNNARYIDYIINTREDQLLEHYGFDIYKMAKETGLSWVVTSNQISYHSPAVLMEIVTIETQLIQFDTKNLLVEARMWNEDKTRLKAILWTRFTHFSLKTGKSETHSEELTKLFTEVESPIDGTLVFEERVKAIRSESLAN